MNERVQVDPAPHRDALQGRTLPGASLSASPSGSSRRLAVVVVIATIAAAGLRLYDLSAASFWVDELNTVKDASRLSNNSTSKVFGYVPTGMMMSLLGAKRDRIEEGNPHEWRRLGATEFSARLASCLFGIVSIPILALSSRRILGNTAAGYLALFLAFAPWHVYWSQAARFYTQQFLFYNLALIWYFEATQRASRPKFAASMVAMVLAFLTQPPALVLCFVLAADWALGLLKRQPVRLGWFGWAAGILAGATCATILAIDSGGLASTYVNWFYQSPLKIVLGTIYMVNVAVVLVALSALTCKPFAPRLRAYLLLGAVVPIIVFAVFSLKTYVGLRYVFVSLYAWSALAAIACDVLTQALLKRVPRPLAFVPVGLVFTSMAFILFGYYTSGFGFHTRWRDAFAFVDQRRLPGQHVLTHHKMIGQYYLEDPRVGEPPSDPNELRQLSTPSWIVVEAEDSIMGVRRKWLRDAAQLKAYFDLEFVQPRSSVHVYYFDPATAQ